MIYKLIISLLVLATLIYYLFCFLEIFGLLKFTDKKTEVKMPQMFIPFYYILKKEQVEEDAPASRSKKKKKH